MHKYEFLPGKEPAWELSELGRMGVVMYAMRSAHNRDTYMSTTSSVRFGNLGPEQPTKVRDFATHGEEILGGPEPWTNRMDREIVYNRGTQFLISTSSVRIFNNILATRLAD